MIQIKLSVLKEKGGFIPGKSYQIELDDGGMIKLDGVWNYTILKKMEYLKGQTFFQYKASGMFNGMIYPVRKWNVCCILYYQGESNTGNPSSYSELMKMMVSDWRAVLNQQEIPFIYVQLAGFLDSLKESGDRSWARLREQQRLSLEIPNSAMAVIFDAGEYNDLHPQDKATVGYRLSLAVRHLVYGEDLVYSGPMVKDAVREGEYVRVSFSCFGSTLCAKDNLGAQLKETNEIKLFEVCPEAGAFVPARACIDGDSVLVRCGTDKRMMKVRYAWRDFPFDANLYNTEGLPASPFMVDVTE